MPLSAFSLDTFVSQGLSGLKRIDIPPLGPILEDRQSWYENFVLNSMFHHHIADGKQGLAIASIRRAQAAINSWEAIAYLASIFKPHDISTYFRLLEEFESLMSALSQGFQAQMKALGTTFFAKGDGSVYERLNLAYNTFRHFKPEDLPEGYLHAVWLQSNSISCVNEQGRTWNITFLD